MKKILLLLLLIGSSASATTITSRVATSSDDANAPTPSAGFNTTASTMYVGLYYGSNIAKAGMRFNTITIPPGSTINSASISGLIVRADGEVADTAGTTTVRIVGEDTASAATFTDSVNFNARGTTTAQSGVWTIAAGQLAFSVAFTSVDCASVIQEIVDRTDWSSGNAIALFVIDAGSTRHRRIRTYDGDSPNAPLLTIDYTVGGGPGPSTTDLYIKGGITLKSGTTIR